jgi:hypothetical protein
VLAVVLAAGLTASEVLRQTSEQTSGQANVLDVQQAVPLAVQ